MIDHELGCGGVGERVGERATCRMNIIIQKPDNGLPLFLFEFDDNVMILTEA